MSEFLAMGGYAAFVWSAFGFALVVLLGLLGQSWRAAHQRDAELAQLRELVRAGRAKPVRAQPHSPAQGQGSSLTSHPVSRAK